eukprot:1517709-Amphidinium_carterae.2
MPSRTKGGHSAICSIEAGAHVDGYSTVDEWLRVAGKKPIHVNKDDSANPSVRCRLVVKETRHHSTISDPSQTWTPALRFMCSMATSALHAKKISTIISFFSL